MALAFLLGLQLTVAQPHGKESIIIMFIPILTICAGKRHQHRDELVARETKIVYVDQNGNPIADPATTPATAPDLTAPPNLSTLGSTGKAIAPRGLDRPGIVYSPYNDDGTCKSTAVVAVDIGSIHGFGFGMVRIYGVDCNQVSNVLAAAKTFGMKVFLGIFDMGQCEAQLAQLIQFVGGDWSPVYAISIGNELVNSGAMSAVAMVEKVNSSRNILRIAGYGGPVVIVDTWVAIIANPILCQNSDFVAANCHAFFDGNVLPNAAGKFMSDSIAKLGAACGGKPVLITGRFYC